MRWRHIDGDTQDDLCSGTELHLSDQEQAVENAEAEASGEILTTVPRTAGRASLHSVALLDEPVPRAGRLEILRREATFRRALVLADMVAAACALLACVVLGNDGLTALAALAVPLVILVGKGQRIYDRDELLVNKTTLDQAPQLFHGATLYTLIVVLLQSVLVDGALQGREVLVLWGTLLLGTLLARRLARFVARKITQAERCLFVGTDESFARLRSKLPQGSTRATIVGRMYLGASTDGARTGPGTDGAQTDLPAITLRRLIDELDIHRVIIEPDEALPQITMDFVREAKATSVRVSLLPRILEVVGSAIEIDDVNGLTLLGLQRFGLSRSSTLCKRGLDVTVAGAGLILMAPFMLVVAALIKLDGAGPVLFGQRRVGRGGHGFEMWKFRTMVTGADALKAQLALHNEAAAGLFKIADDPRVTRIGRWLRRSSLDELPQLINVLRGEMSLVGPRPLITDEDDLISGLDRHRLHLTPGMTGHWQIAGSSRVPLAEMVKLDYLYVAGWSLWTDIKILLRTIPHVLARRGL